MDKILFERAFLSRRKQMKTSTIIMQFPLLSIKILILEATWQFFLQPGNTTLESAHITCLWTRLNCPKIFKKHKYFGSSTSDWNLLGATVYDWLEVKLNYTRKHWSIAWFLVTICQHKQSSLQFTRTTNNGEHHWVGKNNTPKKQETVHSNPKRKNVRWLK